MSNEAKSMVEQFQRTECNTKDPDSIKRGMYFYWILLGISIDISDILKKHMDMVEETVQNAEK